MKAFYSILASIGAIIILGTAGESDLFGLEISTILYRLLWGFSLVIAGRIGYVAEVRKYRRSRRIHIKTNHSCSASKAA